MKEPFHEITSEAFDEFDEDPLDPRMAQEEDNLVTTSTTKEKIIQSKKSTENEFQSSEVMYTLGISLSSMVVITVIAILIIFVIKRRRQRMLKKLAVASSNGKRNLGTFTRISIVLISEILTHILAHSANNLKTCIINFSLFFNGEYKWNPYNKRR